MLSCLFLAVVKLAAPFTDGAVLQRDTPVRVWGTAAAGEQVQVSFAGQNASATASATGAWSVELAPLSASRESRELVAAGADSRVTVRDVLVGEVWLCAGQSNADCPIWGKRVRYRDSMGALTLQTTRCPWVRVVKVPNRMAVSPRKDLKVKWVKMTPEDLDYAHGVLMPSALGYYFARDLAFALDVPVGLVDTSWGGTNIDAWTPREGYAGLPGLDVERNWTSVSSTEWTPDRAWGPISAAPQQPSVIWNGMVEPWVPMAVRGFIWYQGCNNSDPGENRRYATKMHALYNGWARAFKNPDLSLHFVQLAPWGSANIPYIQEAQARFAAEEPHASMAVINDTGNLTDIHPNDKRTPAKRLLAQALKRDYGWAQIKDSSPTLTAWRVEGDAFVLSFKDVERWFIYNPAKGDSHVGFEVAGADGVFKPAVLANLTLEARRDPRQKPNFRGNVTGSNLIVRAAGVAVPKYLRYLYSKPWFGGLYNEVGLPLGAFHIGDWESYLKVPKRYDDFPRKVEKGAVYDGGEFIVESYVQANGPDSVQHVLMAIPKNLKGKAPAVIVPFYVPEEMLGFDPKTGLQYPEYKPIAYMADLARRGFVTASAEAYYRTYAPEHAPTNDWTKWSYAGGKLLQDYPEWTGMGKLIYDTRLLTDLVAADARVDTNRLGITGHSLGGKMAYFTGCIDPRIKVIVASDFGLGWEQTNWKDVWYFGKKIDQARAEGLNPSDLLSLTHGKPFCLIAGKYDDAASGEMMRKATGYENHPDYLKFIHHATGHRPPPAATLEGYQFLERFLKK